MVEVKYAPYILNKGKIITRGKSIIATMIDNVTYAGVIKFIFDNCLTLDTKELGVIEIYINEIIDLDLKVG